MKPNINICIIGCGRFGSLLVKILKPFGKIHVVNRTPVKARGIKNISYNDLKVMDWVIPAVPISALEQVLLKMKPHLKPGTLVMDVCSVKIKPCQWMRKKLPRSVEIIGTHPMFGPDSARYGLKDLQIIICPVRAAKGSVSRLKNFFSSLGLKVVETTPERHDREAAKSLALVHFIGRGLSSVRIRKQEISSLGFERLLSVNETVANDTRQLFIDMHRYNPYAGNVRNGFIKALDKLNNEIINKKLKNC